MSADLMPLRYAVVGAGMMGVEHIHALKSLPATEVVALCDPHAPSIASALAALTGQHGRGAAGNAPQPRVYDDVAALVHDGGFDVAVVATPNFTHRAVVEPLMHHGAHLLIEKPLCISTRECRELIAIEQATARPEIGRAHV